MPRNKKKQETPLAPSIQEWLEALGSASESLDSAGLTSREIANILGISLGQAQRKVSEFVRGGILGVAPKGRLTKNIIGVEVRVPVYFLLKKRVK